MAKDGMGTIVKLGLVGGAAYLAWSSGLLSQALAALGFGTAAVTTPPATTTGAGSTGTLPTGGGGSTNTGAPGSGSSPAATPPPAPPPTCAAVKFTCPDGSVLTQTPGNYPGCNTSQWVCPVPPAAAAAANSTNASDLAIALNTRAMKDGVAQGATVLPAATGYPNGQVLYTPQQWNFVMREIYPNAAVIPSTGQATTSEAYVLARLQGLATTNAALGLSGYRGLRGIRQVQHVTGAGMKILQGRAAGGDLLAAVQLRSVGVQVPRVRSGARLRLGPVILPRVAR
jgi:hypothetical protein